MVSRQKFNKIKKENPESRIWKREWKEQESRNALAKILIKAKKEWVDIDYIKKIFGLQKEKEELEKRLEESKKRAEESEKSIRFWQDEAQRINKEFKEADSWKLKDENLRLKSKNKRLEYQKNELQERNLRLIEEKKKLLEAVSQFIPSHFEIFSMESWIDENKLLELQKADLVLIYRDNNTYRDMANALGTSVSIHWWNVYCISIPQGTEEIRDDEKNILKTILTTCNCMTDYTVEKWTWVDCKHFQSRSNERDYINIQKFLWITKNLEKKFIEKWIDTVCVCLPNIFDHWWMCQREDWSIYFANVTDRFDRLPENEKKKYLEDSKRFWQNIFPNSKVEFIEKNENLLRKNNIDNTVVIADRHCDIYWYSWQKIFFAWYDFEPRGWIENFVNDEDYKYVWSAGEALAESIMMNISGSKNTEKNSKI